MSADILKLAGQRNLNMYSEFYDDVCRTFQEFKDALVICGAVPGTLEQVKSSRICFLSIDMNCAEPEIAAIEYFWNKLVSGAVVVLDDYNTLNDVVDSYGRQRDAFDVWARREKVEILSFPTGQGLIFKP